MRQSVRQAFPVFSKNFEGYVRSMYLDIKGLVTTGVGNLIDTPEHACSLPWKHADGRLAERHEIAQAWQAVKAAKPALHYRQYEHLNDLRLTDGDIDALVLDKLNSNFAYITSHSLPVLPDAPADAQLAVMSMAWALGPGFPAKWGNFTNFAQRADWTNAGLCSRIREEGNPGVIPRNKANLLCFNNAATVVKNGLDFEVLNWPATLVAPVVLTPEEEQA